MTRYLTSDPMPGYDAEGYYADPEPDGLRPGSLSYRTPSPRPEPDGEPCDFFDPYEADYAADREAGGLP